jgi:uncharacterized phage protein (TIGR01671 family)
VRKIKFRAWDPVVKKMFVPEFLDCEYGELWFNDYFAGEDNMGPYPNKPIPMQYTCLRDKNGKEIYEGDILGGIWGGYIGWCETCCSFSLMFHDDSCAACSGDVNWREVVDEANQTSDSQPEVIGNIYSNPELMERR